MNRLLRLASVFPVLCLTALAQEPQPPAAQLQKFQPLIGSWEVSGTMRVTPDAPESPWTARESNEWALGGHFIHQQVHVNFGEVMPDLAFSNYLGWDNENGGYVMIGAGNHGIASEVDLYFPDDNTILLSRTSVMEGQLVVEREVIKFGNGGYSFEISTAMGDGPFFTQVKGTGKKASSEQALAVDAAMAMAPPAPEMAALGKMAGEYTLEGSMVPAPGAPEMEISGTEVMRLIMGGTVLESRVTGNPLPGMPDYEAVSYTSWNPVDKCYDMVSVDNMGMSGTGELRIIDDRTMVATAAAVMYGQPTVNRTILKLNAQGQITSVVAHVIAGAGDPEQTFSATYRRIR